MTTSREDLLLNIEGGWYNVPLPEELDDAWAEQIKMKLTEFRTDLTEALGYKTSTPTPLAIFAEAVRRAEAVFADLMGSPDRRFYCKSIFWFQLYMEFSRLTHWAVSKRLGEEVYLNGDDSTKYILMAMYGAPNSNIVLCDLSPLQGKGRPMNGVPITAIEKRLPNP